MEGFGGGGGGGRAGSGRTGAGSGSRNKEGDSLLFITGYYSIKNTYLTAFSVPDFTFCDCILRYNFFDEAQKKTILKKV